MKTLNRIVVHDKVEVMDASEMKQVLGGSGSDGLLTFVHSLNLVNWIRMVIFLLLNIKQEYLQKVRWMRISSYLADIVRYMIRLIALIVEQPNY